ncbi:MAG TPA: hypothetical protein VGJ52_12750 [Vicinamibacterales bacterium]
MDVKASSAAATSATPQGNVLAAAAAVGNDQNKGKHKGNDKDDAVTTNIYNGGPANVSLAAGCRGNLSVASVTRLSTTRRMSVRPKSSKARS